MNRLHFYGGAESVTGACYLFEMPSTQILIDCGLFQGGEFAEDKNKEPFLFDPAQLEYVFITHAHIDHIGRLPKLYKEGFRGKIFCTHPSRDLAEVMLTDAVKIMGYQERDHGREPLYELADMKETLQLFEPHNYNECITLNDKVEVYLRDSAHILGSCMVEVNYPTGRIVFTGDIGNPPTPLLEETYPLESTDYLVMESVYGDRLHESHTQRKTKLERLVEDTVTSKGVLIIPAFALERTQELLAELNELIENNRIPQIPIYIDSPLAIHATEAYKKNRDYFSKEAKSIIQSGDELLHFPGLHFALKRADSIAINEVPPPKLIIAGNPHGRGSRIAHHFRRYLSDPANTVLFAGFQQPGSLGRKLAQGAKEIYIGRHRITVNAQIHHMSGYSSHADQAQLLQFVSRLKKPVKKIFLAMGEESAAKTLATKIRDNHGIQAVVPKQNQIVDIE